MKGKLVDYLINGSIGFVALAVAAFFLFAVHPSNYQMDCFGGGQSGGGGAGSSW